MDKKNTRHNPNPRLQQELLTRMRLVDQKIENGIKIIAMEARQQIGNLDHQAEVLQKIIELDRLLKRY
jgi:hypothetical protein